jgi:hypothetical protein
MIHRERVWGGAGSPSRVGKPIVRNEMGGYHNDPAVVSFRSLLHLFHLSTKLHDTD